jgi:hypothetical protein
VVDAWRGITRVQIRVAFLFGCAAFLYHFAVFSFRLLQKPLPLHGAIAGFVSDQLGAFALMLGVVVADQVTGRDGARRTPYAVAVAVSAVIAGLLVAANEALFASRFLPDEEFVNAALYSCFEWLVLGGTATFVYTDRRRARTALARMHAAQIDRARSAKRTLESRLQAMQARVEPQFLFNTLAQVRDLYRTSSAVGERMLDELIAYLRAAMPKMRDTSSTVGQELDLVRAYLGIVRLRLGERLSFDVETPDQAADARMPPMMLLPLVDHAIAHGLSEPQASGSIRIRARIAGEKLCLEIADSGIGFLPGSEGEGIAGIRERLSGLYGSDASLVLRQREASATEAVLEIRYEPGEALAGRVS